MAMVRDSEEAVGDENNRSKARSKQAFVLVDADCHIQYGRENLSLIKQLGNFKIKQSLSKIVPDLKYFLQMVSMSKAVLSLRAESGFNLFLPSITACLKILLEAGLEKGVSFEIELPDGRLSQRIIVKYKVFRYFKEDIFRL